MTLAAKLNIKNQNTETERERQIARERERERERDRERPHAEYRKANDRKYGIPGSLNRENLSACRHI